MNKKLPELLKDCMGAYDTVLIDYLESNPVFAKDLLREMLDDAQKQKMQLEIRKENRKKYQEKMAEIIEGCHLHIPLPPNLQERSLKQELSDLVETIGIFKRTGYKIFGLGYLQEIAKTMTGHPALDTSARDLITFMEDSRSLGFKRGPTVSRLSERVDRRPLSFCEALTFCNQSLKDSYRALSGAKSKKGRFSVEMSQFKTLEVVCCEMIKVREQDYRVRIELRFYPSLKKIGFNFTLCPERMSLGLDFSYVWAYQSDGQKMLLSPGESHVPGNVEFYENTFFKKVRM